MTWPPLFFKKIRSVFRKRAVEQSMVEEMRSHVELQTDWNIADGMAPEQARHAAMKEFGAMERVKEECRDEVGLPWVGQFFQDVRYGLRQLAKAPGFAAVAILTIAIGIGACTALFSVVNTVLLKPLEYEEPDRIVQVCSSWLPKYESLATDVEDYQEWVKQSSVFEEWGAFYRQRRRLTLDGRPQLIMVQFVTENFSTVYRLKPEIGRFFTREEQIPGKNQAVVLSHSFWREKFGGSNDAIGKGIKIDEQTYTVVGVANDPAMPSEVVYLPAALSSTTAKDSPTPDIWPVGRLKPGVTVAEAQAQMDVIADRIADAHPEKIKGFGIRVIPVRDAILGNVSKQLYSLLGAVAFLFLIACVNVACLLLGRANARQKEIAVRAALGAARGRIIRQFLCESLLISVLGGLLGIMFAYAVMGPLGSLASHFMPRTQHITVDGTVLIVTCGLMLLAGLGFGLIPAIQSTQGDMIGAMKDGSHQASGGGQRQRVQRVLVTLEIALALIMLTGTGLLVRSLHNMQTFDQGVKTQDVFTNKMLIGKKYDTPEKLVLFINEVLERVHTVQGVRSAAFASNVPMDSVLAWFYSVGGPSPTNVLSDQLLADVYAVTPDYFGAMGIPLILGRNFSPHDSLQTTKVVLVNQEMVRRHFPNENPIGKRVRIFALPDDPVAWGEIVGVVGNVKSYGPMSETKPQIYQSLDQVPLADIAAPRAIRNYLTLIVQTDGKTPGVAAAVREIMHAVDRDISFDTLYAYEATIAYSWVRQRFSTILFTLFSGVALLLAAVGIYGVMAYGVSQRTREIGIRMALGARPADVLRMVYSSGSQTIGLGILLGAAGSLACTRLIVSLLFNTSPYDPLTFVSISALLAAVAFLACWLPARRATKVDPIIALRAE